MGMYNMSCMASTSMPPAMKVYSAKATAEKMMSFQLLLVILSNFLNSLLASINKTNMKARRAGIDSSNIVYAPKKIVTPIAQAKPTQNPREVTDGLNPNIPANNHAPAIAMPVPISIISMNLL